MEAQRGKILIIYTFSGIISEKMPLRGKEEQRYCELNPESAEFVNEDSIIACGDGKTGCCISGGGGYVTLN